MRWWQQRVVTALRRRQVGILMNPLVIRIVIDADKIQILGTPAELGAKPAGDHVPRLELRLPVTFGRWRVLGVIGISGDVNDWFTPADASIGIDFAHCFCRGDRGAHELGLELGSSPLGERVQEPGVAAAPGYERDLAHGGDVDRTACFLEYDFGSRTSEARESIDESRTPNVQAVRPAVVKQVPDDLCFRLARGAQHRQQAGKVVRGRVLLDQVPAHTITRGADSDLLKSLVILQRKLVVPCRGHEIEADSGETSERFTPRQAVRRAFEAAHPKALKY